MFIVFLGKKFLLVSLFVASLVCAEVWDMGTTSNRTRIRVLMNDPADVIPFDERKVCLVTEHLYVSDGGSSVSYSSPRGTKALRSDVPFVVDVIKRSFNLWHDPLVRLGEGFDLTGVMKRWQKPGTIDVFLNQEVLSKPNAWHAPATNSLHFPLVKESEYPFVLRTSRNQSIVAHESGHAVLHQLRPDLEGNNVSFIRALHEAFGDVTYQFLELEQMSDRNLRKWLGNPVTCLLYDKETATCGRDPINAFGVRTCEEHDLSQALSRFVYLSTMALYDESFRSAPKRALSYVKQLFLMAVIGADFSAPTEALVTVAWNMVILANHNPALASVFERESPSLIKCYV